MQGTSNRRRTRGGLFSWLTRSLTAALVGILVFLGGIGAGTGLVGYLERSGLLVPPAGILAKRPSVRLAVPAKEPVAEPDVQVAAPSPPSPPARGQPDTKPAPSAEEGPEARAPTEPTPPETEPAAETQVIPAWMLAAVPVPVPRDRPMVAIIIDDLAVDQARSRRAIELPGPLTMAFLPYGSNLEALVATARDRGHEIMVHLPMEPIDPEADPGPHALLNGLEADEIRARLALNLTAVDGYVGINNHMGSRFSAWEPGMRPVMEEIRRRGLIYVDSLTTPETVAKDLARSLDVPYLARDVFLDYDRQAETVTRQLQQLERIAMARGYAIGIAHPYDATIDVMKAWLETAEERGFAVVPVSAIARFDFALRG